MLDSSSTVRSGVQRFPPFRRLARRKTFNLPLEGIKPVVRIAHRSVGPLAIGERIIVDHEFVFVVEGEGELALGDAHFAYGPHTLLFIPPFVPHSFSARGDKGGHIAVHFDFAPGVPAADEHLERRTPYQVQLSHALQVPQQLQLPPGHRIENSLLGLLRDWTAGEPWAEMAVGNGLVAVLVAVFRLARRDSEGHSPLAQRNQARLERAIEFIKANLDHKLSANDLAAVAQLSPSRFTPLFRQMTGYSPLEYVRRARVDEARRLLADVDLSIKEIAARTGFEDSFHFSKVFRRVDGLSPTQYREALLASAPSASAPQFQDERAL